MKRVKLMATALALAVCAVMAGGVAAQQTNTTERTILTFSSAVELPGVMLQPGTYVFKLADNQSRNVVQVWNEDETNMLGHWVFVQAERPRVTDETVVMFSENREGATPAVQYWYFPGEKVGKEFIYPDDQAERIAARTGQRVRTEDGIVEGSAVASAQTSDAPVSAEASADVTLRDAPASAQPTAPAGSLAGNRQPDADADAELSVEAAVEPAPAVEAPVVDDSRADTQIAANQADDTRAVGTSGRAQAEPFGDELPRTASPLALSGLIGLLSLMGAAGIRAFRS